MRNKIEYIIWDDYTDEFWCSFYTKGEAETYYNFTLKSEGHQVSNFSIREI